MASNKDRYKEMRENLAKEKEQKSLPIAWDYSIHDAVHDPATGLYSVVEILYTPGSDHNPATVVVEGLASLSQAISKRDDLNMKENIRRLKKQFPKT